jgi:hypothetical protein
MPNSQAKYDPNSSVEWLAAAIGQATRSAQFVVAGPLSVANPGLEVEDQYQQVQSGTLLSHSKDRFRNGPITLA